MSLVIELGLVKGSGKAEKLFTSLLDPDFRNVSYSTPHEYVKKYWEAYQMHPDQGRDLNGKVFELIIETLLYRENILPYYIQAKAAFVPNVVFDVLLYRESEPICISIKTSLRERYKQADLEAVSLKYVHRKSHCYLLTLEKNEATSVSAKIGNSEVLGLDDMIYCLSDELDHLIDHLQSLVFTESIKIDVFEGQIIKHID